MNKLDSQSEFIPSEKPNISVREEAETAPNNSSGGISVLVFTLRFIAQLSLMAIILGLAFLQMQRMIASKPETPQRPIFPTVYTVETVMANQATHQPLLTLYGEVVAGRSVDLRSLVSGKVVAINDKLKAGGRVQEGDALVEIDSFAFEGALREAKANEVETRARIDESNASIRLEQSRLASGTEQLKFAKNDLARIQELKSKGSATQKQVDDRALLVSQRAQAVQQSEINIISAKAKLAQQQAALDRIKWKIEQSERNLSDTVLKAPFTGTIRSNQVEVGKTVGANDIVVSMYQTGNLEARFVLTDERFGRIQADKQGLIDRPIEAIWAVGGKEHRYKGKIDRIGAEIASTRGGVEIYARLDPASDGLNLRPGAFVELKVPDQAFENHFKIPDTAIYNGNKIYVVKDKKLEERTVSISSYEGEAALIASGLSSGDEVLTTRISEVSAGLRVRKEGDPVFQRGRKGQSKEFGKRNGQGRPDGKRKGQGRPEGKRKRNKQEQGS